MSTVFSTVLIASPPAFLTGWLLSKALFRQLALRQSRAEAARAESAPAQPAFGPGDQTAVRKLLTDRQQSQQIIQQLREQLAAAQQRLQPLQGDVQLLKEAVAEREHQLTDLRRKLQLQAAPPEVAVGKAAIDDATRDRQALKAARETLALQEQKISEQAMQIASLQNQLQATASGVPYPTPSDYSSINQENLQMLRGLGPALHKKLNERGIYRLGQLAELTPEEAYRLCRSLGVAHKTAIRNDWSAGARELLGMGAPVPASLDAVRPELN